MALGHRTAWRTLETVSVETVWFDGMVTCNKPAEWRFRSSDEWNCCEIVQCGLSTYALPAGAASRSICQRSASAAGSSEAPAPWCFAMATISSRFSSRAADASWKAVCRVRVCAVSSAAMTIARFGRPANLRTCVRRVMLDFRVLSARSGSMRVTGGVFRVVCPVLVRSCTGCCASSTGCGATMYERYATKTNIDMKILCSSMKWMKRGMLECT